MNFAREKKTAHHSMMVLVFELPKHVSYMVLSFLMVLFDFIKPCNMSHKIMRNDKTM